MIKMSLLLLLGLGGATILRNRSAAIRHAVLAAAIACAAATPLLQQLVPVWRLPLSASLAGARVAPLALLIPIHEREVAGAADPGEDVRFVPVQPASAVRVLGPIWMAGFLTSLAFLTAGLWRLRWLAARAQRTIDPAFAAIAATLSRQFALPRPV